MTVWLLLFLLLFCPLHFLCLIFLPSKPQIWSDQRFLTLTYYILPLSIIYILTFVSSVLPWTVEGERIFFFFFFSWVWPSLPCLILPSKLTELNHIFQTIISIKSSVELGSLWLTTNPHIFWQDLHHVNQSALRSKCFCLENPLFLLGPLSLGSEYHYLKVTISPTME